MNTIQKSLLQTLSIISGGYDGHVRLDLNGLQSMLTLAKGHAVGGVLAEAIMDGCICITDASKHISAQGGLSVADGCRCLTKELDMIAG